MTGGSDGRTSLGEVRSVVETWDQRRKDASFKGHRPNLNEFVGVMNANTRKLVSLFEVQNPDFWTALAELATNAATMTDPQANLFADGAKVTDL